MACHQQSRFPDGLMALPTLFRSKNGNVGANANVVSDKDSTMTATGILMGQKVRERFDSCQRAVCHLGVSVSAAFRRILESWLDLPWLGLTSSHSGTGPPVHRPGCVSIIRQHLSVRRPLKWSQRFMHIKNYFLLALFCFFFCVRSRKSFAQLLDYKGSESFRLKIPCIEENPRVFLGCICTALIELNITWKLSGKPEGWRMQDQGRRIRGETEGRREERESQAHNFLRCLGTWRWCCCWDAEFLTFSDSNSLLFGLNCLSWRYAQILHAKK